MLVQEGSVINRVPSWPNGRSIGALAVYQDHIYAVNRTDDTSRVWRYRPGSKAHPITALDAYTVQAFAATPDTLWAVSDAQTGGRLWRSPDGMNWTSVQSFPVLPVALTVVDRQLFVGTYDTKHGGALWGPAIPRAFPTPSQTTTLPPRRLTTLDPTQLDQTLTELDALLARPPTATFRQRFFDRLLPLALSHDPKAGQALSERLNRTLPQTPVSLIGGKVKLPAARLAQWLLIQAIAQNGHGYIPPRFLTIPWSSPTNQAEKYFEPVTAAAWAVAELGQRDAATLTALTTALDSNLPLAERGDLLAALHILDSRPFRYPSP